MKLQAEQQNTTFSKNGLWWRMIIAIVIIGIVSFAFSAYPAQHGADWFHHLKQPFFAPPYWLPFVMWSLVYVLIGCSVGIVWQAAAKSDVGQTVKLAKQAIVLFAIHLIFNLSFPLILIGFHLPILALVDILILIGFILILIQQYMKIDKTAAYLLIPYLIWIIYATLLDVGIIVLN